MIIIKERSNTPNAMPQHASTMQATTIYISVDLAKCAMHSFQWRQCDLEIRSKTSERREHLVRVAQRGWEIHAVPQTLSNATTHSTKSAQDKIYCCFEIVKEEARSELHAKLQDSKQSNIQIVKHQLRYKTLPCWKLSPAIRAL